ncbi:MAG: type II/IV secretion system protein [Candidatus Eisenbacteria bacterium]|nr:type II/IV secretion system protein [Candidatus Eisenbacteria bacterium]
MTERRTITAKGGGRLGERLVERGCISEAQLSLALKEQERTGGRIGEILVALGFTTEQEITSSLANQAGLEQVQLSEFEPNKEALALLDESFCRERSLLPLDVDANLFRVAMANSFDVLTVDEVSQLTGRAVEALAAPESEVLAALDRAFGVDVRKSLDALVEEAAKASRSSRHQEIHGIVSEQPVVRLVDAIIREAVRRGATDVHVEPEVRIVRTRNRIDGVLVSAITLPLELRTAVTARIKLLADLDIAETRLPQDGKITAEVDRRQIMIRVSTLPTIHGENVVMRLLDKSKVVVGLEDLGFADQNLGAFSSAIQRASGIILVTGPTGSGKTTTLYAALKAINTMDRKIATLEDPVEYELPVVRQSQVNVQAGFTFAKGLRALLRQDPDVILVGEMRDAETVETALRAAMTGHLVLSTLHTNSAIGAIARLLDMGVEPFLLGSTLVAVVAQRLVRRLCVDCREPDPAPDPILLSALGLSEGEATALYRARGCKRCGGTGYRGRRAVAEVLTVTPAVGHALVAGGAAEAIGAAARREGMVSMLDEARRMVISGETSVAEALRHTWDNDQGLLMAKTNSVES